MVSQEIIEQIFQEIVDLQYLMLNEHYDDELKSILQRHLDKVFAILIEQWEERLENWKKNPEIAKGMDPRVAMGVQESRLQTLKRCIRELKEF